MKCKADKVFYKTKPSSEEIKSIYIGQGMEFVPANFHEKKTAVEVNREPCDGTLTVAFSVFSQGCSCCGNSPSLEISWECTKGHPIWGPLPFYDDYSLQQWVQKKLDDEQ